MGLAMQRDAADDSAPKDATGWHPPRGVDLYDAIVSLACGLTCRQRLKESQP